MAKPCKRDWVSTTAMAQELGCSVSFLLRHRDELFMRGQHWKVMNPIAYRKTYRWNRITVIRVMEHGTPQES